MLTRPMKRICPSLMRSARSNTWRQDLGLKKGSSPSTTSISAKAPSSQSDIVAAGRSNSQQVAAAPAQRRAAASPLPRMALKNSLPGSSTITSDLLRKVAR